MEWLKQLWNRIRELFRDKTEYTVIIWYVYETVEQEGTKVTRRKQKGYSFSKITKKTNTHFVGKGMQGQLIEIKSVVPFDFEIHRVH